MNTALVQQGIGDQVATVGQFMPRGSTGGMFGVGTVGSEVGGWFGSAGDAIGTVTGAAAGRRAAGRARGLPLWLLVGVSDNWVYGFAGRSRSRVPDRLVFRIPRNGLQVEVKQRVNVRTLTLTSADGGGQIELEGNRLPITHSKDVINALRRRM